MWLNDCNGSFMPFLCGAFEPTLSVRVQLECVPSLLEHPTDDDGSRFSPKNNAVKSGDEKCWIFLYIESMIAAMFVEFVLVMHTKTINTLPCCLCSEDCGLEDHNSAENGEQLSPGL